MVFSPITEPLYAPRNMDILLMVGYTTWTPYLGYNNLGD